MKFGELMSVFSGWRIRITAVDAEGGETKDEICILDTVNAHMKLASYAEAAVVRFATGTMDFEGQQFPALEVVVNV